MSASKLPANPEERDALLAKIIQEVIDGKSLREVAKAHGISHTTVHAWLLGEVPQQFEAIRKAGLIARIVNADEALDSASDHVSIARAREQCKFARWDAERRLKALFSPSQEITGPDRGPIQLDNLERARRIAFINASVIEAEIVSTQCSTTST